MVVHIKTYVPGVVKPVIVDVLLGGFVIVAVLVVVQRPVPGDGFVAAIVAVPVDEQIF